MRYNAGKTLQKAAEAPIAVTGVAYLIVALAGDKIAFEQAVQITTIGYAVYRAVINYVKNRKNK